MKTQICIATGQPLPNLIAVLHARPEKVIVVATQSMNKKAKEFKEILRNFGVSSVFVLDNCPDTNLQAITDFLNAKLSAQLPSEPCLFNLTGGTKMHSFSMYEVFKTRNPDDQFIYVDTQNRLLEYYPNQNGVFKHAPLPSVLTAKNMLKGMGKNFIKAESNNPNWQQQTEKRQELTYLIAQNIHKENVKDLIGSLNTIIGNLYKSGKQDPSKHKISQLHKIPKDEACEILTLAHGYNVITWHNGKEIEFTNYQQARYLSGAWLEEYVWLVAQQLSFEEQYSGLTFASDNNKQARNEIDLFIQHQNMALAIECKSATSATKDEISQNMFHKLTGVASRSAGLTCGKLFVSAFELKTSQDNEIPALSHAKEQNIVVVQGMEIVSKLPEILKKWHKTGRLP